ncbi:MAG: carbohydrate ABC transporter permease [Microbacterium sp.]|uniref:carbohydrate ABC transporter permease n=1 Tax=Microbacterium sp. TaxID=51671 RepID=UPI003C71868D
MSDHARGPRTSMRAKAMAGFTHAALVIAAILFLSPILYIVLNSFKVPEDIFKEPPSILPERWTLQNYITTVASGGFGGYFWNTVVITVVGVVLVVVLSSLAGYGFAKLRFRGSALLFSAIIATLTIPLAILLVPMFIMESRSGILNTQLGLILPNVAVTLPFAILIMHKHFADIPVEIEDSAEMDGAGRFRRWWSIMLPLTKNGMILVTVITTYSIWGEYTLAKTLATSPPAMPLSVGLTLLKSEVWEYGTLAAVITLAILPPIIIFALFQRKIVEGITQGAVKG